jgi:hypothetical protein
MNRTKETMEGSVPSPAPIARWNWPLEDLTVSASYLQDDLLVFSMNPVSDPEWDCP